MKAIWKYIQNLLLALDLMLNAIFLGDPEETISSRIGKKVQRSGKDCKVCHYLCKFLDWIDPRHCRDAINWNEGRGSEDDDSVR